MKEETYLVVSTFFRNFVFEKRKHGMTNSDFWASIKRIIDDGFTADGLAKLETYAEQFTIGRLVYQRFSPFEQHGCTAGGLAHVIATLLTGAETTADKLTAPLGSFEREQQRGAAQEAVIERWARAAGLWTSAADQALPQYLGEQIAEGGEAHVYDHGSTLVKSIGLDYFILPQLALDRITLHNAYFPETRMAVLGFGRTTEGQFQIIVEQPFIQGEAMTDEEIRDYVERLGFRLWNPRNWTFATPSIYLSDLHDENVIRSRGGSVFVVDCDIRLNTPDLRTGGTRLPTNTVQFPDNA